MLKCNGNIKKVSDSPKKKKTENQKKKNKRKIYERR